MAGKKKAAAPKKGGGGDLIISKSRTKAATKKCNVGGEFYGALDQAVRRLIAEAENRETADQSCSHYAFDHPGNAGEQLHGTAQ